MIAQLPLPPNGGGMLTGRVSPQGVVELWINPITLEPEPFLTVKPKKNGRFPQAMALHCPLIIHPFKNDTQYGASQDMIPSHRSLLEKFPELKSALDEVAESGDYSYLSITADDINKAVEMTKNQPVAPKPISPSKRPFLLIPVLIALAISALLWRRERDGQV